MVNTAPDLHSGAGLTRPLLHSGLTIEELLMQIRPDLGLSPHTFRVWDLCTIYSGHQCYLFPWWAGPRRGQGLGSHAEDTADGSASLSSGPAPSAPASHSLRPALFMGVSICEHIFWGPRNSPTVPPADHMQKFSLHHSSALLSFYSVIFIWHRNLMHTD